MDDQKRINELYEKAIKSMQEYSAHDVKKIREITDGVCVRMIEKDAVLNNDGWIPLIFENGEWEADERLKDHYFYLVAHKAFSTPMKAKYHDDGGLRCFQIVSNSDRTLEHLHNWDTVYCWMDSITHWRELPDLPEVPGVIFGDKKYWEDKG